MAPALSDEPPVTWKVTLPCTHSEGQAIADDLSPLALLDSPPVLITREADPAAPEHWLLDAYFEVEPDANLLAMLSALIPSAVGIKPKIEKVQDQDWVTISQQGLEPIRAGRFFVHTPAHREAVPADAIAFEIDAGRAFGTGQHETTTGCLMALDSLKDRGAFFSNLLDLGTGTGLLAFAAMKLWPSARATASDIDPVSIEVTKENAAINKVVLGRSRGRLELVVSPGLEKQKLKTRAPYDLVVANILAAPLIELAPAISDAMEAGGRLILAGLLDHQADKVAMAYRRQGLMESFRIQRGEWPTLVMRKRRSFGRR